jgi:hypothetical protein
MGPQETQNTRRLHSFMCDYPIQSAAAPAQSSSPAGSQNTASNSFQTGVITANGYEIIRLTRVLRSAMKLKAWEKARIVEQNIEAVSSKLRAQAEAMPELAVLANQKLDEIQETLSKIAGDLTESEPIGLISETDQIESKIVQLISTLKNAGKEPAGSTKPSAAVTSILICPDGPHNISVDPNFIRRPGCVICFTGSGEPAGILDPTQLQVNDNLFFGFISKKPKDDDWQSLGVFGFPELFLHVCPIGVKTCGPGSIANGVEALNNLKLFVFEASAQSGGASQSGGKNSSKSLGAPFIVPPVGGEI